MDKVSRVLFAQSFGLMAEGGSAKIFRSLVGDAPAVVGSMAFGTRPPATCAKASEEWFVRERVLLGRLERTRFAGLAMLSRVFSWRAACRLASDTMTQWEPDHVHAHLHGVGFIPALDWCRAKGVPFSVSVHDDIRHLASMDPWKRGVERAVAKAWRAASNRFVISPEIGDEYSRRYGERSWIQVTDGLSSVPEAPRPRSAQRLNLYFAGAINVPYEPNFLAMQKALGLVAAPKADREVRFILRGGRRLDGQDPNAPPMENRPFAPQEDVLRDFEEADLLYLPLSADPQHANFAQFSLSTKMITYLGSGLPIFYHGPEDSAAYRLLSRHNACVACFSNDPAAILQSLGMVDGCREVIVNNALRLGSSEFRLKDIRERFWSAIYRAHITG